MLFKHLFFLLTFLPPTPEKIPTTLTQHGDQRVDHYYWLKEKHRPQVLQFLKEENAYAEAWMATTKGLQKRLYDEFLQRLPQEDESVPIYQKGYVYTTVFSKDKPYAQHLRNGEIFFDENVYAEGKEFFSLGALSFSPNQTILAYTTDLEGNERYTLQFKNFATQEEFNDLIQNAGETPFFANDNKTIFYTVLDEANRAYRLYRHSLGTTLFDLVYEEKDPCFGIHLTKSHDEKYLFFSRQSLLTSTTFFLDANHPFETFCEVVPEKENVEYKVEHREGNFYLLTNANAPNFKVMVGCQELIAERKDVVIEEFEIYKDFLVLFERKEGIPQIEVINLCDHTCCTVAFSEPSYSLEPTSFTEFDSNRVRFSYSSFLTPASTYEYTMETQQLELKKKDVVGPFNPCDFVEKRLFAKAADGTCIPISLVYKKGISLKGLLLTGYGAYGMPYPIKFSRTLLSLLDRGVAYAVAHIRGGGEFGRRWYDAGRLYQKKNTFTDFIAVAQFFKNQGFGPIVIRGKSAGGLLMGAVTTMRPDLFAGVVAQVPFVDVVTTMGDPTIPLTLFEYQEWGDPKNCRDYFYMKSYSPYDNTTKRSYPPLLIMGGLNDTRVAYFEPAKWAAKLREMKTDTNPLLLKTLGSGHFGASDRYNALEEEAFVDAFILKSLSIND